MKIFYSAAGMVDSFGPRVIKNRIMPNRDWKYEQWVIDLGISGLIWDDKIHFRRAREPSIVP